MENEVIKCILNRHCCRDFLSSEIPEDDVEKMVEALRWAPSAGNLQPWHFYIVKNRKMKNALAAAAFGQTFMTRAAIVFVVCAVPSQSARKYGRRGSELYCIQDTAAAVENLLLAATALRYGSCWVGAFDENAVSAAMTLPPEQRPVAIIPVGPGIEDSSHTQRHSVNSICEVID